MTLWQSHIKVFLLEVSAEYRDQLYCYEVCWVTQHQVFERERLIWVTFVVGRTGFFLVNLTCHWARAYKAQISLCHSFMLTLSHSVWSSIFLRNNDAASVLHTSWCCPMSNPPAFQLKRGNMCLWSHLLQQNSVSASKIFLPLMNAEEVDDFCN